MGGDKESIGLGYGQSLGEGKLAGPLVRLGRVRGRGRVTVVADDTRLDVPRAIGEDLTRGDDKTLAMLAYESVDSHPAPGGRFDGEGADLTVVVEQTVERITGHRQRIDCDDAIAIVAEEPGGAVQDRGPHITSAVTRSDDQHPLISQEGPGDLRQANTNAG
jgi:hypothetical protein